MDISQYWKPQEEVVPTKKGLCLRPLEFIAVKELVPEIGRALPELDGVVPCNMQSNHMNQLVALQCLEYCNLNENWYLRKGLKYWVGVNMFANTFMSIALLDELLFWMRCP